MAKCSDWRFRRSGRAGAQIAVKPGRSALDCAAQCLAMPDCVAIVWNGPASKYHDRKCGFKCSVAHQVADPGEQAVIVRPNLDKCGARPPPPPPPPAPLVPMPADWVPAVNAVEMLYGGRARLGPLPLYPNIGNGYVGGTLGESQRQRLSASASAYNMCNLRKLKLHA